MKANRLVPMSADGVRQPAGHIPGLCPVTGRAGAAGRRRTACLACALALALGAGPAQAVGLGSIEIESRLNERLDARIPVHELDSYPLETVSVGLAPMGHFRALGIRYRRDLRQLEFALTRTPAGDHVIQVRSRRPIVEPFISFVLELDLPDGSMIREYTVLVDPPPAVAQTFEASGAAGGEPAESGGRTAAEGPTVSAGAGSDTAPTHPAEQPSASTAAAAAGADPAARARYGPVRPGSSAWLVAEDVRPPGISIYQTMIALFRANPGAFEDNDLEKLRAGAWLDVPTAAEVAAIPYREAVAVYRQQIGAPAEAPVESVATAAVDDGADAAASGDDAASAGNGDDAAAAGNGAFDSFSVHAAEPDMTLPRDDASAGGAVPAGLAELRAEVDAMQSALERLQEEEATDASLAALEQRLTDSMAVRDEEVEDLRAELATVQRELAVVRNRAEGPAMAAVGGVYTIAGVAALLGFVFGALGGIWGARRIAAHSPAAVPDPKKPLHEILSEQDSEVSAWEAAEAELPAVRRPPELNENRPPIGQADWTPPDERAEAGPDAQERQPQETEGELDLEGLDAGGTLEDEAGEPVSEGGRDIDAPEPTDDAGAEGEELVFGEADTEYSSDFYTSLARLYLEAGWPNDVEELLREIILRNGDEPVYRALILEAMYQLGDPERFLKEYKAYQAIAPDDDPSRGWVMNMGARLCPDSEEFGEGGPMLPAAGEPGVGADAGDTPAAADDTDGDEVVFEVDEEDLLGNDDLDLDDPESFWADVSLEEPEDEPEPEDFPQLTSMEAVDDAETGVSDDSTAAAGEDIAAQEDAEHESWAPEADPGDLSLEPLDEEAEDQSATDTDDRADESESDSGPGEDAGEQSDEDAAERSEDDDSDEDRSDERASGAG